MSPREYIKALPHFSEAAAEALKTATGIEVRAVTHEYSADGTAVCITSGPNVEEPEFWGVYADMPEDEFGICVQDWLADFLTWEEAETYAAECRTKIQPKENHGN